MNVLLEYLIKYTLNCFNEYVLPTVVQLRSILQYSVVVFDNSVLINYMF